MQRARLLAILYLVPCLSARAADTAGSGALEWHGSVLADYASRLATTRHEKPPSGDFLLGEERLQLQLSGTAPGGGAGYFTKMDFVRDEAAGQTSVDVPGLPTPGSAGF